MSIQSDQAMHVLADLVQDAEARIAPHAEGEAAVALFVWDRGAWRMASNVDPEVAAACVTEFLANNDDARTDAVKRRVAQ